MSQIVHVLNGDSLYDMLHESLRGHVIVWREMMIEGPIELKGPEAFIAERKTYFKTEYHVHENEYSDKTEAEFQRLIQLPDDASFYLWFEYDLFCQVNAWMIIYILTQWNNCNSIHIVYPPFNNTPRDWYGFHGIPPETLPDLLIDPVSVSKNDIHMIKDLVVAYANGTKADMERISQTDSRAFPRLKESINSHLERLPANGHKGAIIELLNQLISTYGKDDFKSIFNEFSRKMGHYGLGDTQVLRLINKIKS